MDALERNAQLEVEVAAQRQRISDLEAELAAKDARSAVLEEQVAKLTALVRKLAEAADRNSSNSDLPPSSDGPGRRTGKSGKGKGKRKKPGKRKRGGQPGHRGSRRELLPAEQVDEFVDFFPAQCENCWSSLPRAPDPGAKRYQTTELPPIKPHTTEYRRHAVMCPCCDHKTRAIYDDDAIPASAFGPRLMSIVALLTGVYHLSRRRTVEVLADVMGVEISLGAVSSIEARVSGSVQPAVDEAWAQVARAKVKHTDGTTWLKAGITLSLWTIATASATVYRIVNDSTKKTLEPLFGNKRGILVSDRAAALNFWAMERRQICWAHLLRKFISFSERDGPAGTYGRELLDCTGIMFEYWRALKEHKLSRVEFQRRMAPVRVQFEAVLERADTAGIAQLSGSCANMLKHRKALWTFVERADVEPTNNHAERELRGFVLWRKRSFGTQSLRGDRFAERLMTIAHTCRKQGKNVLAFLTASCSAEHDAGPTPSLFEPDPVVS